jgi:glutathione synthase/RimK-type ligase-like ATP-grasp enzyme
MAEPRNIALLTDRQRPHGTHDDRLLRPAFAALGVTAAPAIWDDPAIDWRQYAAIAIRSPWDYHQKIAAFDAWLDARDREGIPLWNPSSVIRWNSRKGYLDELGARGIPVIPTWRLAPGESGLDRFFEQWPEIVVKPEVSAGGKDTWRVVAADAAKIAKRIAGLPPQTFLVQPFLRSIQTAGELSFVFLDGRYSHTIRKTPPKGRFLIHEEHGGSLRLADPGAEWIRKAEAVLAAADRPMLYARVDGIIENDELWLIELEALEPELFFRFRPESARQFAVGLLARIA